MEYKIMDLGTELPVLQSMNESENKLNSNGVYHVEDKNGNLPEEIKTAGTETWSQAVEKRPVLKKWRRIPRELVKKDSYINGRQNGDLNDNGNSTVATRADSDQSSRSSTAASVPRMRNEINGRNSVVVVPEDDQRRNGRFEPGKKARGVKIEKENSVESDSRSSNFLFVQGTNTVASKSGGGFASYDEDYSDDANYGDIHFNEEAEQIEFIKSEDEYEDVTAEKHEDVLMKSIEGLDLAQKEFEREVQKWRVVGKDDSLIFDDSIHDMFEIKDAKILELESTLKSGDTELEDLLRKIIQAEVEYVVITTTTESLTAGPLRGIKHNLQKKNVSSQFFQGPKKQVEKLETREDVKKLQKSLCKFITRFMIQMILLLLILYLKFLPQNVEVVPT